MKKKQKIKSFGGYNQKNVEIRPTDFMNINKVFLKNAGIFALFLLGFWIKQNVYYEMANADFTGPLVINILTK